MISRTMTRALRHFGGGTASALIVLCCASNRDGPVAVEIPVASIDLKPPKVQLLVGESAALQWTARGFDGALLPNARVTFVTSASSVAAVSSGGQITATGAGAATITAQAGGASATNNVQVLPVETVADVRVNSMALDVGQNVPLDYVVLNPRGVILTGKSASYRTSSSSVATVSAAGVVRGAGYGDATIEITVDTVVRTAQVHVRPWPQEPDNFIRVTERDFSRLATSASDSLGIDGWDANEESQWPNISVVQDAAAPRSPPSVLQAMYRAGTSGGTSAATPGRLLRSLVTSPQRVYLSVWVQLSSNWVAHSTGTNKVLYVWINGQPRFFLSAEGSNSAAMAPSGRLQGTPDDLERGREVLWPNVHSVRVIPGTWQRWEIVLRSNTPGLRNGEFHLWIDGVEVSRYTDVAYLGSADAQAWTLVDIEPIWGGAGDRLSQAQWMRFDHIYVSKRD